MTNYVYAAAVAAMGLGVILVYMGVLTGLAFTAGTVLVAVGIALAGVGALLQLFGRRDSAAARD